MMEKLTYLNMINATINRMAHQSMIIKVASAFVLVCATQVVNIALLIAAVAFWLLDSLLLNNERLYRNLYDEVRVMPSTQDVSFSMNTSKFQSGNTQWIKVMFSKTLTLYHLSIILSVIGIFIFLR